MKKTQKSYYGSFEKGVMSGYYCFQLCKKLYLAGKETYKNRKKADFLSLFSMRGRKNYYLYRTG